MSRAHPTKAVIFDLDGTLLDSLPLVLRAFSHALSPFGGRPTMEMFANLGGPPEKIFSGLMPDPRNVPAAIVRLNDFTRENHHHIAPFTGVNALLRQLQARGVRLAVWTGRDRLSTEVLLLNNALTPFFDAVVCGDDLSTHKPDSAGLVAILRQLAVSPADALYIGDADVDVLGGAGAGVDTMLISHARTPPREIAAQAWRSVRTPFDAYECALACTAP